MGQETEREEAFDVVIVGGTPGGLTAGLAAARRGLKVLLLERGEHLGGLPANGLGATDIGTRDLAGGLFREFVTRIKDHYLTTYGAASDQVRDCSDGFHFEPRVAEAVFADMVAETPGLEVRRGRQFDVLPERVDLAGRRPVAIRVVARGGRLEQVRATVFIDATYEGDLAAAAGAGFETRRESFAEYREPLAGRIYKRWRTAPTELGEGSTGEGDKTIQAYNYRLCLTNVPGNRVAVERPDDYRREDYAGIVEDVLQGRWTGSQGDIPDGIDRVVNMVRLPNGKTDANNQHHAFVSTDLPEENYPWPTADWDWRDAFARRLRDYTLGLLWFAQHDPELPEDFRRDCLEWGLAADEYTDNGHFPRQVYVREGRRIEGEYRFTAHDALPLTPGGRPPVHRDSIAASHYPIDSHAHRKREPGRVHLDGFLSHPTQPYTVPYGVILPLGVDGLLTPVAVSATHLGFGTLRMEPCWMALGEAAGTAAALAVAAGVPPREVDRTALQLALLDQGAVLIGFRDARPGDAHWPALQMMALRGLMPGWEARLDEPIETDEARLLGVPAGVTRGAALSAAWKALDAG